MEQKKKGRKRRRDNSQELKNIGTRESLSKKKHKGEDWNKIVTSCPPPMNETTSFPRILVFGTRDISARYRHFMNDMRALLPHSRKEAKLDGKGDLFVANEICDLNRCTHCLLFEMRKHKDLYLWLSRTPEGPSVKFYVSNVHTMQELRLTGNCLKGSRPILSFSKEFDSNPQYQLLKELFSEALSTPLGHPESKPFVDHVLVFSIVDNKIWFRNYQIVHSTQKKDQPTLVEIGPRFVLTPIRLFSGSFGGPTVYANPRYVSPSVARRKENELKGGRYVQRCHDKQQRLKRKSELVAPGSDLDSVFK